MFILTQKHDRLDRYSEEWGDDENNLDDNICNVVFPQQIYHA